MMQVYLPIAEMSVHVMLILALGGVTGILSGMFGVGGGFLTTPMLIFIGVPPSVAVATSANQIVAASASGFMAHKQRRQVDYKMGNLMLLGGFLGSLLGVRIFKALQEIGQIDLMISLCYILFLGYIGYLMTRESIIELRARARQKQERIESISRVRRYWQMHTARLPFKVHFPQSDLNVSALLPITIGFGIGMLVALMGVGGGFFLIPAMVYLLQMPAALIVGTSLYHIMFMTAQSTLLHAMSTQTVDIVLAFLLIVSSATGAQIGVRLATRTPAAQLRLALATTVLLLSISMAFRLFIRPDELFTLALAGH